MRDPAVRKIDWTALAEPVATALLGKPSSKSRTELRYGRRGSLKVDLKRGTWRDFETGDGGGMIRLVMRERRCDRAGAMKWLIDGGLVADTSRSWPVTRASDRERNENGRFEAKNPVKTHENAPSGEEAQRKAAAAARLWAGAVPDPGPVAAYLAGRGAWPPDRPLPDGVAWLGAGAVNAFAWRPAFPAAPGAACYAWAAIEGGYVTAVHIEALDAQGRQTAPRWRKDRGFKGGAAFMVPGDPGGPVAVCEGPVDALAVATWRGREAWAAGGAGNMRPLALAASRAGRPVEVWVDGDAPGRAAAQDAAAAVRDAGGRCVIERCPDGQDPNDVLAEEWTERAAIIEAQCRCERAEAERRAWACFMLDAGGGVIG